MVAIGVCMIALIGFGIYKLITDGNKGYKFDRSHLDKYVEVTEEKNLLNDGASVYLDMSDGMNCAYASQQSKAMLQAVINRLAGISAIKFFGLADEKITSIEMSHTQLYNYMLNPSSYNKQKAPIEMTLKQIVENNQPSLLMSDFEEYNGGVIHKAAYAKKYFIEWLAKGFNISFYKWIFTEKGKVKNMFLAVFDDNANRLNSLVENAVKLTNPSIETFVLGSREFAYPTCSQYISLKQGGNYHNGNGLDVVTAVMENGGSNDYVSYAKPYASASGLPGQFAPLDNLIGAYAEYYPVGIRWNDAIANSKRMQETGVPDEDIYTHLLSNLFIDFEAQNGFAIEGIEVRTFDMMESMKSVAEGMVSENPINTNALMSIENPEINMFLTADMVSRSDLPKGWKEITIDFDEKFNGSFLGSHQSTDLIRANVVISRANPNLSEAQTFFSWEGNPSLADSVKETLSASSSSPVGRILYTYYIKSITE